MQTHDEGIERPINWIRDKAKEFGHVKAERIYLEELRKSKKAILMQHAPDNLKTVADKENFAYSHPDYQKLLNDLKDVVQREEELRLKIKAAEMKFEEWRTKQANNRAEMNRYNS